MYRAEQRKLYCLTDPKAVLAWLGFKYNEDGAHRSIIYVSPDQWDREDIRNGLKEVIELCKRNAEEK